MKITEASHLDHGLTPEHIAFLLERFASVESFKIETLDLPENLPPVMCGLYGPTMGDDPVQDHDVKHIVRGERVGASRMVEWPMRETRKLTVIMGLSDGACILFTSYGGPSAPREPFDPALDDVGRPESSAFWAEHALAIG